MAAEKLKEGWEKEALQKVLAVDLKQRQGETLSVLDALRRSRKSRGGVGAPLEIPTHLAGAAAGQGIIITDAMLKEGLVDKPIGGKDE